MHTVQESSPTPLPLNDEERRQVLEQLNRLLESHHFRNSRRYPPLLRFIVEETLAGRGEFLKERLLGIRVFDRPADYDTAVDPIVRVTIAEIRKRIAQYYHDEEHDAEIRIELLPGRYAPEFRTRTQPRVAVALPEQPGRALGTDAGVEAINPVLYSDRCGAEARSVGGAAGYKPRVRLLVRAEYIPGRSEFSGF